MPGLIDAHWHVMLVRPTPAAAIADDPSYTNLVAGVEATDTLMRGFTTVRDMGGPSFSLKRAIDEGLVAGPRIYPSGAMISVTGGHGDFRQTFELPRAVGGPLTRSEQVGGTMIADSPGRGAHAGARAADARRLAGQAHRRRRRGVTAQPARRLDVHRRGAARRRRGRLATGEPTSPTHAYTPAAIQRAIDAGVQCIEHGHLMDEATAQLIAEKGVWLSTQTFPEEMGKAFPPGLGGAEQVRGGAGRHRHDLHPGEEVQDQDRVGHRHPLLPGAGAAPRSAPGVDGSLVHAGRGAQDGHRRQRAAARSLGAAQPLPGQAGRRRGRCPGRPAAGRRKPAAGHQPGRRPGQELPGHHEGRKGPQEPVDVGGEGDADGSRDEPRYEGGNQPAGTLQKPYGAGSIAPDGRSRRRRMRPAPARGRRGSSSACGAMPGRTRAKTEMLELRVTAPARSACTARSSASSTRPGGPTTS